MLNRSKLLILNKLCAVQTIVFRSFVCDKSPLSIIFYGSDDFSIESLKLLKKKFTNFKQQNSSRTLKSLEVVTTSKNNLVWNYCKHSQLNCYLFNENSFQPNQFDLGVVSSFGRLIPSKDIEACKYGMLNIHGSLLPRWRGASPIQRSILHGDKQTGLTIMTIKPHKFDIGQIVAQKKIDILYRLTSQQLRNIMAPLGAQLLWQCIENLEESLANAIDQSEEGVTYAPKISDKDGEIDWERMDSREIDRRVRAFVGFVEMTTQWIDGTPLRLYDPVDPDFLTRLELDTVIQNGKHIPGYVHYHKKRHLICIASANRTWSAFRSMSLKGRKKMSGLGFYNTFMRPLKKQAKISQCSAPIFIVGGHNQNNHVNFDDCKNSRNSDCILLTEELKN